MTLSISEVAALSGLRVSAIRYYEQQCLVHSLGRRSGMRFFDGSVLATLATIEVGKAAGLSLTEIRSVFSSAAIGERPSWRRVARMKNREIAREMKRLERRRELLARLATCACPTLDHCGRAFIAARSDVRRMRRHCGDRVLGQLP